MNILCENARDKEKHIIIKKVLNTKHTLFDNDLRMPDERKKRTFNAV